MLSSAIRRFVGSSQSNEEPPNTGYTMTNGHELKDDNPAQEAADWIESGEKKKKRSKNNKKKSAEGMGLDTAGEGERGINAGVTNGTPNGNENGDTSMQMDASEGRYNVRDSKSENKRKRKRKEKEGGPAILDDGAGLDFEPEYALFLGMPNGLNSSNEAAYFKTPKKHKKPRKGATEGNSTHTREGVAGDDNEAPPADDQKLVATSARKSSKKRDQLLIEPTSIPSTNNPEETSNLRADEQADPEPGEHEDETPSRPSKSALGKQKAIERWHDTSQKSKRKRKRKGSPGMDLMDMGFTSSSQPDSTQKPSDLQAFAEDLYIESTREYQEPPPILPPGTNQAHRPTPTFTPINGRRSTSTKESQNTQTHAPRPKESNPQGPLLPPKSNQKRKRRLPVDEPGSPNPDTNAGPLDPPKARKRALKSNAITLDGATSVKSRGRLTPEDIEAVTSAVEMFRLSNRLTEFEINAIVQDTEKQNLLMRKDLLSYVSERVPQIAKSRVTDLCTRKFHNYARGPWTAEEDGDLKYAFEKFPSKWKQIGPLVNRLPTDARDRWRNYLVCGDNLKTHMWTREEEDQLRAAVAESLEQIRKNNQEPENPKNRDNEELMNWASISSKMGLSRSRLQCRAKWVRLKEREAEGLPDPAQDKEAVETEWRLNEAKRASQAMSAAEKLAFLYAVHNSGTGRESKIPWKIVCAEIGQRKGKRMIYKFYFKHLRRAIPGYKDIGFKDCLERIIHRFEETAPAEPEEFMYLGTVPEIFRRNKKKKGEVLTEEELRERRNRKHVRVRPYGDDEKGRRKRKTQDGADQPVRDGEGVQSGDGPRKRKIRKEKPQPISEEFVVDAADEEEQNADPNAMPEAFPKSSPGEVDANIVHSSIGGENITPKQKKKKLRDRMKQHRESQSQESGSDDHSLAPDMADDIRSVIQSLKKAHKNSQMGQKRTASDGNVSEASDSNVQLGKSRNSNDISDHGDEDNVNQNVAEASTSSEKEHLPQEPQGDSDNEHPRSDSDSEIAYEMDLETRSTSSVTSQAEESVSVGHYTGSIDPNDSSENEDEDMAGTRTPNGFDNRRTSLSPDLDTPVKYDGRHHNTKLRSHSLLSDERLEEQADIGKRAGSMTPALSDVSSSDGSIPARVEQWEDSSSEDDNEGSRLRGRSIEL